MVDHVRGALVIIHTHAGLLLGDTLTYKLSRRTNYTSHAYAPSTAIRWTGRTVFGLGGESLSVVQSAFVAQYFQVRAVRCLFIAYKHTKCLFG